MGIPDEDIAQVRASTDIVALVSEYTQLKRVGRRYTGLCPFHSEKSGSFSVNAEEGLYYCFGCAASGDAITFLRTIEALEFVEAVERLAARAGVSIRYDGDGRDRADREGRRALNDILAKAVAFYHEELLGGAGGARARQYLRSRGYDGETVRKFSIGWAPETGTGLVRALSAPEKLLVAAGLANRGGGGLSDAFRGRVIFPIFDPTGAPVALGGRVLPGADERAGPKYRNSPESPVYAKRRTLYGLNWAKQAIVKSGEVIVCEGYTDVIGCFVAGLPRAVATCGTALTEDHFRLMARFAKRIVLAFDADSAGEAAAARFYEWERHHEIEVSVAAMPPGTDPGELARKDPAKLLAAVAEARTYLAFRMERAISTADLGSAEGRARAAEAALELVAEHPNELVRDQYLVALADRTRLELELLRPRLEALVRVGPVTSRTGAPARRNGTASAGENSRRRQGPGSTGPGEGSGPSPTTGRDDAPPWEPDGSDDDEGSGGGPLDLSSRQSPGRTGGRTERSDSRGGSPRRAPSGERAARDALVLMVHARESIAGRLSPALFAGELQRSAYGALAGAPGVHEAIEGAEEDVADLLHRIAVIDPDAEVDHTVIALARAAAQVALKEIEAGARQAQASGDVDGVTAAANATAWIKAELEIVQEPGAGDRALPGVTEAADRLVAWLTQRQSEAR